MIEKLINRKIKSRIEYGKELEKNYSKALKEFIENNPKYEKDKIIIESFENDNINPLIKKIVDGYDLVNFEIENYGNEQVKTMFMYDELSSGTPMKYKPFKGCINSIKNIGKDKTIYWYPATLGSSLARQKIVDYLIKEGFSKNACNGYGGLSVHNIAFTCSTTEAFSLIAKIILRKEDVILMTGPNYGIFALLPERLKSHVEILDLKEEDNFFINPNNLRNKIDEINNKLKEKYKNKLDYIPKVAAFLNINPHNPIGNVMSKKNISLINEIGDICLEKGVFIIDDLIYRDLTFDQEYKALPIASIPKYFNNTISLFGLSKSYGLAGFRGAFMVIPTPLFWAVATEMFYLRDSAPVLQVKAVEGAFNGSKKRYKDANNYFNKLLKEYKYRLDLAITLIDGIDNIKNPNNKSKIIKDIKKFTNNERDMNDLLNGISEISIRKNTFPESGFFLILDFTKLKGKYYKNNKIETEYDLLKAMYNFGKIKYLMGENFAWPYKDEFVARINFALEKRALINNMYLIKGLIKELKDEKN